MRRDATMVRVLGGAVVVLAMTAMPMMTGCAGYGNYAPGEPGLRALDSPNSPHMFEVIRNAVVAAVDRASIDGPYAVRVPDGMDPTRRARLLEALDDPDARLALPGEATSLPVFTVERAIVRVNHAEVDVAIPVAGLTWPDGRPARQLTTYYLESKSARWRVNRMRTWSVGVSERAIVAVERAEEALEEEAAQVAEEEASPSSDEPPF